MLPPITRLPDVERLIHQRNYFVIHAPRQTSKSTAMLALAQQLTESGRYTAIMLSVAVGASFSHDPERAEAAILSSWHRVAQVYLPPELRPPAEIPTVVGQGIEETLRQWAEASPRPLVVFIDEIDSLQDEMLLSVLCQLRSGFPSRPRAFPHCVGLIGLRDVWDDKVASGESGRLKAVSSFNIKAESLTLHNFTAQELAELCSQHTAETGQVFTPESLQRIYALTQGQPWWVNAIAHHLTKFIAPDPAIALTINHMERA
jgi:hypothetical protein